MKPASLSLRVQCLTLLLLAVASLATAATSPPGVNLRWDNCYGDGGAWNKQFACNTNTGTEQLVGSFELAQSLDRVATAEITLDLRSESATLPAWWDMRSFGGCRPAGLDFSTLPPVNGLACAAWTSPPTGGGLSQYTIGAQGASHARLTAVVAENQPAQLNPGQEYFLFRVLISHVKTVGTGACGGCTVPVCIFLSRISLFQSQQSMATIHLDDGANWLGSQYVTWQNGYPINVHQECDIPPTSCDEHYTAFGCVLSTPTRSRVSTWGQVKALYK